MRGATWRGEIPQYRLLPTSRCVRIKVLLDSKYQEFKYYFMFYIEHFVFKKGKLYYQSLFIIMVDTPQLNLL